MTYKHILMTVAVAGVMAAGCASLPAQIAELDQARQLVHELESHPMAEEVAGNDLLLARQALVRAEAEKVDGGDLAKITHEALVASRHVQIAHERIAESQTRDLIEESEAERNRVLLNARTADAERAKEAAQASRHEAAVQAQQAQEERMRANLAEQKVSELEDSLPDIEARQSDRGLVLTFGDVLFDTNEASLKPGALASIGRLAEFLKENPQHLLTIEGHTDATGEESYNLALSERRAQALQSALISQGIEGERMRAVGLGEAYPVASNDTSAGRQQNRRVEIIVSNVENLQQEARR